MTEGISALQISKDIVPDLATDKIDFLMKKFTNFAVILSDTHTNPIYYL